MKTLGWIAAALGGLLLLWILGTAIVPPASDRPPKAAHQAAQILLACEAYRDHPQNPDRGKYPSALADLVYPPFGGPSFLRNGEADLYDPWGNQFECSVVGNGTLEAEIKVGTVHVVDGKRKEIGVKRCANGAIEVFGHEE